MNSHNKPNLAEAQAAMERLLPKLPFPRLSEYMDSCGVALPKIGADPNLVFLEQPETLIGGLGPLLIGKLPKQWLPAFFHHRQRLIRNAQLKRIHPFCLAGEVAGYTEDHQYAPEELADDTDGIVAAVLLLAIRPMPGPLRTKLVALSKKHWFGSFLALHGIVFENEVTPWLGGVGCDPRLTAGLWKSNPDLAGPLLDLAMRKNDLWSGIIALNQLLAAQWLGRVCIFAEKNAIAAVTALVLQPAAAAKQKALWVQRLKRSHSRLAYLAVRWARHTWPNGWEVLRDELRDHCCQAHGQIFYHWHRDCEAERFDDAIRQDGVDTLWAAELVHHARNSGQELRRRMVQRLKDDADKNEPRLTLQWLSRRGRLHD